MTLENHLLLKLSSKQYWFLAIQENDLTRKQADFMKQLEVWKENEHVRMNSKIDEVKQACQREMDSMHQKNRNLEKVSSYIYVK